MSHPIIHTILLILAVSVSFLFSETISRNFELQLIAILFVIYFVAKRLLSHIGQTYLIESIIFTIVIVNIVLTTGGTSSVLFFLLYFLLFALSLILEPVTSMTTSLAIALLLIFQTPQGSPVQEFVPILSLLFLTPFALFVGKEYRKVIKQKKTIKFLQYKDKVTHEDEETQKKDTFMFLSVVIKGHLDKISDLTQNFKGDHELDMIKRTVKRMKKLIDDYESSMQS